jgi:flavin reductase (DIM6/NTAB) family NADH-FMN oxidoreductase RutF
MEPAVSTDHKPFEDLVSALDYAMFVVTTRVTAPAGCLVGFAGQTSIDPPHFLVSLSRRNATLREARRARHLAVHLIPREHLALAELFGGESCDDTDKFAKCAWYEGPAAMPILGDASAWFVGEITARFDVGDHVGHLLEPIAGFAPDTLPRWVSFADVRDLTPGHQA